MANIIRRSIPNTLTSCNLFSGCVACYMAFQGNYAVAFAFIILGATFDFFDGMTARLLHVSSPIGKELDSLADDITFGIAPAAIAFSLFKEVSYPAFMQPIEYLMPYTAFLISVFSALRLAKFNLDTRQSTQFIGLPTPANALFWGSLLVGHHAFLTSLRFNVVWMMALALLSCYLLVCEVPMMALKFKSLTWAACRWKVVFLLGCLPCLLLGYSAFAAIIVWYIVLSAVLVKFRLS